MGEGRRGGEEEGGKEGKRGGGGGEGERERKNKDKKCHLSNGCNTIIPIYLIQTQYYTSL